MSNQECLLVWEFLSDVRSYYPHFDSWFFNKVCPDLPSFKRRIIYKIYCNSIIGVSILKKYPNEKKISTFKIHPDFRNSGIGSQLMSESLDWLECSLPLITVNQDIDPLLSPFLSKFKFQRTSIVSNLYLPSKNEIIYNSLC